MANVLIFRTDINSAEAFRRIQNLLYSIPSVSECTVDLEDIDKVLRVVSSNLSVHDVEKELSNSGFFCKELDE